MESTDYPALYQSADSGSNRAQRAYLAIVRSEYTLLAIAALLNALRGQIPWATDALVFLLVLLFGLLIFRYVARYDRQWYACRALAESVKTSSWKFLMRSHPFENSEEVTVPVRSFLNSLKKIRDDNDFLGVSLDSKFADKDQISDEMMRLRSLSVEDRREHYLQNRVRSQRQWYARKASWNTRRRQAWFGVAILIYALAVAALLSPRVADFDVSLLFDFLIVLVTASFGWLQVKRHGELAASYTLTAHEIGEIQGLANEVDSEQKLSDFVNAAEFAFSREHTQWAARRDFN
ncbi:MAG: DUF4231 domain-containing protein [Pseudomonadota bacterium]